MHKGVVNMSDLQTIRDIIIKRELRIQDIMYDVMSPEYWSRVFFITLQDKNLAEAPFVRYQIRKNLRSQVPLGTDDTALWGLLKEIRRYKEELKANNLTQTKVKQIVDDYKKEMASQSGKGNNKPLYTIYKRTSIKTDIKALKEAIRPYAPHDKEIADLLTLIDFIDGYKAVSRRKGNIKNEYLAEHMPKIMEILKAHPEFFDFVYNNLYFTGRLLTTPGSGSIKMPSEQQVDFFIRTHQLKEEHEAVSNNSNILSLLNTGEDEYFPAISFNTLQIIPENKDIVISQNYWDKFVYVPVVSALKDYAMNVIEKAGVLDIRHPDIQELSSLMAHYGYSLYPVFSLYVSKNKLVKFLHAKGIELDIPKETVYTPLLRRFAYAYHLMQKQKVHDRDKELFNEVMQYFKKSDSKTEDTKTETITHNNITNINDAIQQLLGDINNVGVHNENNKTDTNNNLPVK